MGRPPTVYTAAEVQKQTEFIEGLMMFGASQARIMAAANRPPELGGLGISQNRAKTLIDRITARWEVDNQSRSKTKRYEAEQRILRQIQNCQGTRDPKNAKVWIEKPNHVALAAYEALLAKIQGTLAPVEIGITLNVGEAMAQTFARYSLDRLKELHERARTKTSLARAYLREHPEVRPTIDVEAVVVEERR